MRRRIRKERTWLEKNRGAFKVFLTEGPCFQYLDREFSSFEEAAVAFTVEGKRLEPESRPREGRRVEVQVGARRRRSGGARMFQGGRGVLMARTDRMLRAVALLEGWRYVEGAGWPLLDGCPDGNPFELDWMLEDIDVSEPTSPGERKKRLLDWYFSRNGSKPAEVVRLAAATLG